MIFPSTIIIGNDLSAIDQDLINLCSQLEHNLNPNNPDILKISEYSIESIKSINNFLSRAPYSHSSKIVIIPDVDLLLTEAQNALLKILEEPGNANYFILTTSVPGRLVSTILSRCHQIRLHNSSAKTTTSLRFSQDIKSALLQSETIATDKVALTALLQQELGAYHQLLIDHPSQNNRLIIQKIIKALNMLHANVDPKSALDFLLLS